MTGRLIGVGVGPGDPELLTIKAARLIDAAPVIAYPQPDDGLSFARSIVAERLGDAVEEPIVVPMRTARFPASEVYDEAVIRLAGHLEAGRDVVVLCEGDPFFYGSFMYIFARLNSHYATEIVPGVSSITAASAASGLPLAARNDVLTVLPAPLDDEVLERQLQDTDAAIVIKLGRHLPRVRALLDRLELTDATQYCERVGLDSQRLIPLRELGSDPAPYFSLLLIYNGAEEWVRHIQKRRGSAE